MKNFKYNALNKFSYKNFKSTSFSFKLSLIKIFISTKSIDKEELYLYLFVVSFTFLLTLLNFYLLLFNEVDFWFYIFTTALCLTLFFIEIFGFLFKVIYHFILIPYFSRFFGNKEKFSEIDFLGMEELSFVFSEMKILNKNDFESIQAKFKENSKTNENVNYFDFKNMIVEHLTKEYIDKSFGK